jgi:hypothetical protein
MPQEPMIKLDPGGTAPILSYNVPEPTSYTGRHVIELELPQEWFTEAARDVPPPLPPSPSRRPARIFRSSFCRVVRGARWNAALRSPRPWPPQRRRLLLLQRYRALD